MESKKNYILGIDLGTTNSYAGVWREGKVEIIPNGNGNYRTPSMVAFTKYERLFGDTAKNQMLSNYTNTIYDSKRLIGRRFSDREVKEDKKYWPFKVDCDQNDIPMIQVEYEKNTKKFYPEQISGMILDNIKKYSRDYLGSNVKDIILTCPATFNDSQRQATIDAAKIAGLNVIKLLNEPTAAAIAYGLNEGLNVKKNICVFDLGGGTFDVTILEINNKKFTVKAIGGDSHLGGQDFDNELMNYIIQKFKNEKDINISTNEKAKRKLKSECEKIKNFLSFSQEIKIDLESFEFANNFDLSISRYEFEKCCDDLFKKCIEKVKQTLNEINYTQEQINEVILSGGASRIPKIKELLSKIFPINKLKIILNPDELITVGATHLSHLISENKNKKNEEIFEIIDINPHSLGIGLKDGKMSFIIKKNEQIPCEKTKRYKTIYNNQTNFSINIFEGEDNYSKNNNFIQKFIIDNIRKAPKGEVILKVTFKINENSILEIFAEEEKNIGNSLNFIVERKKKNHLKVDSFIEEENEMNENELKYLKKRDLEYEIKKTYSNNDKNSKKYKKAIEIEEWLKNSQNEKIIVYESKIKELGNEY